MVLTKEQIKELKSQLLNQTQHLSPEQKSQAEEQIHSMSPESLELMLKQQSSQQKIFRMLVEKQIPSVSLGENEKAIAILSTKAISKGHTLIIPKSPITNEKDIPKEAHTLSEIISKKLIFSLKASSTSIIPEKNFGEIIINIIPIYGSPLTLQSLRKEVSLEELEKIKTEINVEKIISAPQQIKIKKKPKNEIVKLKRRVP